MARVLVIGNGGREHALAYRFSLSHHVETVYVAPGSPCMKDVATCVAISSADFDAMTDFALEMAIDLVVIGPEEPLVNGLADVLSKAGIRVFGPSQYCAQLEGSKAFAKEMMMQSEIPTASYKTFSDVHKAIEYVSSQTYPLVLKASGLAAGKGVVIVSSFEEAERELKSMMVNQRFNDAGTVVVIEEFLAGEEFSYLCLVSGTCIVPLQVSQDHKRAFDGDHGPNTGGMGAYTPVDSITAEDLDAALSDVVEPIVKAMSERGHPYTGVLYAGLMKTADGLKVIEFNVRFGDPETEVLMLALESDLYCVMQALLDGEIPELAWSEDYVIGTVLASAGYPASSTKGVPIHGLKDVRIPVFHMGTACLEEQVITDGGRVLCVCAKAPTLREAHAILYHELKKIQCDQLFYRNDIGFHNIENE